MEKTESYREMVKHQLTKMKSQLEELNVQLHLGLSESRDEYEKQKKDLSKWIKETNESLEELKDEGNEKFLKIKRSLEELRLQANLGKTEAEDVYKEQQEALIENIHDLKNESTRLLKEVGGKTKEVLGKIDHEIGEFRTQFDLFKLQMRLGKSDVEDAWEEKKKELSGKIQALGKNLEDRGVILEEKWDDFAGEMEEAWDHFKKAFKS